MDRVGETGSIPSPNESAAPTAVRHSYAWRIARIAKPSNDTRRPTHRTAGLVQACICRGRDYTELYTKAPQSIPVDGTFVQELIGPESQGPYR